MEADTGTELHTRRLQMNNTPHYHHVLLISEHPKNILQVHCERGQKVPQCPQEPLCGHPSMWVKQTHWASPSAILTWWSHHMFTHSHTYIRQLPRFVDSNCKPSFKDGVMWLILSLFFSSLDSDDYNRVQLATGNGSAGCDYINASFIDVQQTQTHIQTFWAVDPQLRTFWVDQDWRSWSIFDVHITYFLITGFQGIQKVHSSSR